MSLHHKQRTQGISCILYQICKIIIKVHAIRKLYKFVNVFITCSLFAISLSISFRLSILSTFRDWLAIHVFAILEGSFSHSLHLPSFPSLRTSASPKWKHSSGEPVLPRTSVHTILRCAAMHHNADVKTSLSPALSVRCDGALQIANSLTKCTLSTPRWKVHDNVTGQPRRSCNEQRARRV